MIWILIYIIYTQFLIPNLFGCLHKLSIVASPWQDLPTWLQLWHHVALRKGLVSELGRGAQKLTQVAAVVRIVQILDSLDSWTFWKRCHSLSLFVFIHRHSLSGMTLQFAMGVCAADWRRCWSPTVDLLVNEPFCTYEHRYSACALPVISSWVNYSKFINEWSDFIVQTCLNHQVVSLYEHKKYELRQHRAEPCLVYKSGWINDQRTLILKAQQKVWLVQPLICGRWRAWERAAHFLWTTRPFSVVCGESSDTNLGWTRWEPGNGQAARLFDRSSTAF